MRYSSFISIRTLPPSYFPSARDFGQQAEDGFPDDGPETELRIVERAAHRQVHVDHAVAVLEQGHREFQRNGRRILRIGLGAELEIVEHDVVRGVEPAVRHLVFCSVAPWFA